MRIIAFGAHADDVEICMAGTVAEYVRKGHQVKIVTVIIPCEDIDGNRSEQAKEVRRKECENAATIMGAELEILDMDPYDFVYNRNNVKLFDKIVRNYNPDSIFTSWHHDSHQDHATLSHIIFSAARKNTHSLYLYEPMSPGGITPYSFRANMFVDITQSIDKKMNSVKSYESVRSLYKTWVPAIEGRAKYRGNQIGVDFAEAFEVVKEIKNF